MLSSASCGMPVGYSAILLPQLKNDNGTMGIDDETGSWIGKNNKIFIWFLDTQSQLQNRLVNEISNRICIQITPLQSRVNITILTYMCLTPFIYKQ